MKIAALAVVALIILAPLVLLALAAKRQLPCICEDADDCTCGGAWGGRRG